MAPPFAVSLVRWLFATTGSLTHRAARAGVWLAIGDASARLAGIVKLVILARLLAPADFGIIGLGLLVTGWVHHFTETGFSSALIHQRGDIRPYLNTAWTAQLARSVALAGVIALTAPLAAWVFSEPLLVAVLRVMAIETIIHGLRNPAVVYFRKDLDTRREVLWRTGAVLAGFLVGVPAAFVLRNVWALVLSLLAAAVTGVILSYWVHPYRPSLQVDWPKLMELARFGRWIFGFRLVSVFTASLDSAVVGRLIGSVGVGFYHMASQFTMTPVTSIGTHLHAVMFPAFSKLTDDIARHRAFVRVLGIVIAIAVPGGLFLTLFGGFAVRVALGAAWKGIEPLVEILAWVGVIRAVTNVVSAFLLASGRPDLDFRSTLPKLVVLVAGLYPATVAYGTAGAALVLALATVVSFAYQVALLTRVTSFALRDVGTILMGGALTSLPLAAAWLAMAVWSPSVPLIAAGAAITSAILAAVWIHGVLTSRPDAVTERHQARIPSFHRSAR